MDSIIREIIENAMRNMGYDDYQIMPLYEKSSSNEHSFVASNEYCFMVSKAALVPAGFQIISNTEVLVDPEASDYADLNYVGVKPFSGQIDISQNAGTVQVEFIRVRPNKPANRPEPEHEDPSIINPELIASFGTFREL